jgi:hypothetical protein
MYLILFSSICQSKNEIKLSTRNGTEAKHKLTHIQEKILVVLSGFY